MARLARGGNLADAGAGSRVTTPAPPRPIQGTDCYSQGALHGRVLELLERRTDANERFFGAEAERIARLCELMAERFARGGRLLALGASPQARSDARHVAVEFVHPVIVGKRALPALALTGEGGQLGRQVELLAEPDDIAIAFEVGDEVAAAVALARARGCVTVATTGAGAEWEFRSPGDDPFVHQELGETLYHVLWELVHVFLEHLGRSERGGGASSFLYPFLDGEARDREAVVADVRDSVLAKAAEIAGLRAETLHTSGDELWAAAGAIRGALDEGRTVLAFGNGGSATDATDAVADFRAAPTGWPARRALDLTEDGAILTALANDIGADAMFARQLIAYGRPGDIALALSTSGNSTSIVAALREARRRGLVTVALVGYDGGQVASERLADHVIVAPSEHIPRIQEAHATALHVLRELVEVSGG